jgi:imidazolonepropionase-like amidohydrolase
MKLLVGLVVLLALVMPGLSWVTGVCADNVSRTSKTDILLRNVSVFDVSNGLMTEPQDILIRDGRISDMGQVDDSRFDGLKVDCAGKFAVPGLFECHAHLTHLTGHGDDSLGEGLKAFVDCGVLQVRDVGGPIDVVSRLSEKISSGELIGPEMFFTGPMLEHSPLVWESVNDEYPGFTVAIDTEDDVDSVVPNLVRQGACLLKTFNKFDHAVYRHLLDVAEAHSLRIVHDPGSPLFHWMPMDEALKLGVTSFEHAKAPWPVVLTDELRKEHDILTGLDADQTMQRPFMMKIAMMGVESVSLERLHQLADTMKARCAFLCPTLQVLSSVEKEALEGARESMGVDTLPDQAKAMVKAVVAGMDAVSRLIVREFAAQGVRMLVGQDGCTASDTFAEMRNMKECGVSEAEVLKGATIYPAEWLGVDDRLGSISAGKQANIVVVDENPLADIGNIESTFLVVRNGAVVARD